MYDPSAPFRARMMPVNDPYTANPVLLQEDPANHIKNRSVVNRIPTYFYPRYNGSDDSLPPQPKKSKTYLPPHVIEQPLPHEMSPYGQPIPYPMDPYAPGSYYPHSTPYLIPMTNNIPQPNPVAPVYDQSKGDVLASHQQDADLSRLEVYHFTPKQNTSLSMGIPPAPPPQPVIQYHVYQYPSGQPPPVATQQPSSYPPPWYAHPPYEPSHFPELSQPIAPPIETKARGSQTEPPSTKNRGISPMSIRAIPAHDQSYPYVHHTTAHTDRHKIPRGRLDRSFSDEKSWEPLSDCRCMDCQSERAKVPNYYPD